MVRITAPSQLPAWVMQERAGTPSISTVQAPHTPCSQPRCVPVSSQATAQKVGELLARLGQHLPSACRSR